MTIKSQYTDLHKKIEAFKLLFGREPEITAIGPFDDKEGEAVFGFVKVTEVKPSSFLFEADGDIYEAFINAVPNGFYLQ